MSIVNMKYDLIIKNCIVTENSLIDVLLYCFLLKSKLFAIAYQCLL